MYTTIIVIVTASTLIGLGLGGLMVLTVLRKRGVLGSRLKSKIMRAALEIRAPFL